MLKQFSPNAGILNPDLNYLYGLIVQREVLQQSVTVGVAATALPTTPLRNRKNLDIFNNSGSPIYIGSSSVTTANGFPLYPHASMNIQIEDGITVYAISSVAGCDVRIIEGA